jgi:hypothetical protein
MGNMVRPVDDRGYDMSKGIESDLALLEESLRKLEWDYEQFFAGNIRILPFKQEASVQGLIRTYSSRAIQNPALRFRYANLVARFNSFKRVWERKVREMEEGRAFGRPLKAQSPPQRRQRAAQAPPSSFVADDLKQDQATMQNIFDQYRHLREECGESTGRLRLENFTQILADKVEQMKKAKKCEKVEVHLRKSKNKTRIVVKPYREDESPA